MIRRRRVSLIALIAALPLSLGAAVAQQDGETTEPAAEEPASSVPVYSTGPKRMKVPSAETVAEEAAPEPAPEVAAEPEPEPVEAVENKPITDVLPEAGGSDEPETASGQDILPEAEGQDDQTAMMTEPPEGATEEGELLVVAADAPAGTEPFVGDYTIGDPDAPVQVIEYASFTCPHCAAWHMETWPEFKAEYVDSGKVGFTLREVYFDPFGLWASMTARCGGEAGFYPMADQFLKKQAEWARAEDPGQAIQKIGRLNGLTTEQLKGCLENQEFAQLLVEEYQTNSQADGIQSTPSFVVEGPGGREVFSGNMGYEEFKTRIDEAFGGS